MKAEGSYNKVANFFGSWQGWPREVLTEDGNMLLRAGEHDACGYSGSLGPVRGVLMASAKLICAGSCALSLRTSLAPTLGPMKQILKSRLEAPEVGCLLLHLFHAAA